MPATLPTPKTLRVVATPRDYQARFLEDYLDLVHGRCRLCNGSDFPGTTERSCPCEAAGDALYSSPTGSGKSLMELLALEADPDAVLITPRLEIVAGMLNKLGVDTAGWTDEKLAREALSYRITTPVRFRNMLMKGEYPYPYPRRVIIDEAHHDLADTYQQIRAFLPGALFVGLTATPFRGTAKGTVEFLKNWGNTYTAVLTLPQAVARGVIEIPTAEIWPLADDDEIEVVNGDFRTVAAGELIRSRLDELVERCKAFVEPQVFSGDELIAWAQWDRPTLFAVPTTDTVRDLVTRLNAAGLPAVGVTQDTPRAERNKAFADCVAGRVAIVQIDVVSEGVDLPIRRLIDLRPTMSPVKWLQQVGRITRPRPMIPTPCGSTFAAGEPSVYICCCRNLERHAYLMNGLIPAAKVAEAQQAFEKKPTKRAGARAVGLENLSRFAGAELPLADGCTGLMYSLYSVDGQFRKTEYAVLLHPAAETPLVASRSSQLAEYGTDEKPSYGRWARLAELPTDLRGFASTPAKSMSDKQAAWWGRDAVKFGLDPNAAPNRRSFAALPVLADLSKTGKGRIRLTIGGF